MLRRLVLLAALMMPGLITSVYAGVFERQLEGQINLIQWANSPFDRYTENPSQAEKNWLNEHYWRMIAHPPYFDSRLAWYPDAWAYFDVAAVYTDLNRGDVDIIQNHPDWIYQDRFGNKLYIPWGCSGGTCPQYAGNIGNPAFRAFRIEQMRTEVVNKGYRGLWLDDVNMLQRTGDGQGNPVVALDPNTGQSMTLANWRRYMATYMEEVRQAFPNIEIVHNGLWFADEDFNEPSINRQLRAADYFNAERGPTDPGLTGGEDGQFAYKTFLRFMDHVHDLGSGVLFLDYGTTLQEREFGLASWFLISEGIDMMASDQLAWTAPDSYWAGYDINLGQAKEARYETAQGLIRRDFECGSVVLNPPGEPLLSMDLGGSFTDLAGRAVSFVQLPPRTAAILRQPCQAMILRSELPGVIASTEVDHNQKHINFSVLNNPVVIAAAPSQRGRDPGVVRLQNVNNGGFDMQFQEWDYRRIKHKDVKHKQESVSYLALETGRYQLSGGAVVEVGSFDLSGTGQFGRQTFSAPFPGQPAVFLTMQSRNGGQAATVRARHVSTTGFDAAIYEQESLMDGHKVEKIGYLAMYTNTPVGSIGIGSQRLSYERRQARIGDAWVTVAGSPIRLQEEQSADEELIHYAFEAVDIVRLDDHVFVQDVSSVGGDTVAPRRNY